MFCYNLLHKWPTQPRGFKYSLLPSKALLVNHKVYKNISPFIIQFTFHPLLIPFLTPLHLLLPFSISFFNTVMNSPCFLQRTPFVLSSLHLSSSINSLSIILLFVAFTPLQYPFYIPLLRVPTKYKILSSRSVQSSVFQLHSLSFPSFSVNTNWKQRRNFFEVFPLICKSMNIYCQ